MALVQSDGDGEIPYMNYREKKRGKKRKLNVR